QVVRVPGPRAVPDHRHRGCRPLRDPPRSPCRHDRPRRSTVVDRPDAPEPDRHSAHGVRRHGRPPATRPASASRRPVAGPL
ncbi:MAG: hypothetical protein AVDCRST_MAG10-1237, partial [uncultured Acidimicrobiales bacterium]